MGATASTQPTLIYGQIRKSDTIDFEAVCAEIALATSLTKGDVQNAITALIESLKGHLGLGQSVKLGDLGRFRMVAGSAGVTTAAEFTTGHFKRARVVFVPGPDLKALAKAATYERLSTVNDTVGTTGSAGSGSGSGTNAEDVFGEV
jgi:predicted histone-like DNA-binding protein